MFYFHWKIIYCYNNNHVPYILRLTHLLEVHYLKDYQDHNTHRSVNHVFGNRGSIALWISNFPSLDSFTNYISPRRVGRHLVFALVVCPSVCHKIMSAL